MFNIVIVCIPCDVATHQSQYVAMLQCNRGYTHRIAVGRSEREARAKLEQAKREDKEAVL